MQEKISVSFVLNGEAVQTKVSPKMSLLRFLRDEMRLTGTKNGCSTNHCGACTVLVDGAPLKSCMLRLEKVQGRNVETIEGLSKPGELHPVQAAFLAAGAVQCGFCTPGMIMAAKALLDRNSDPGDEAIKEALKGNICRCTGYVKIIQAVKLAARWLERPEEMSIDMPGAGVGRSAIDLDGIAKVKGSLAFADDMYTDGMLHGKVLWSAWPHAEILGVDTSEALAMPGVAGVLTARDVPGRNGMGFVRPDHPVLCSNRARYTGDAIAVVYANTAEAAEAAVKKIKVEARELPGLFTPWESLKPEALKLHDRGNLCEHLEHEVGDVEGAMGKAALVVEGHFETPFVEHAYLEPESGVGMVDADGILTVHAPTQSPFEIRKQIAAMLNLTEESVRVVATHLGGGFGSKVNNAVEGLLALGAYHLKRPVKITLTREESMRLSTKRHPYWMDYRVGFDRDGRILAVKAKLVSDAGPYTASSPRVIDQACIFSCGPYRVPNVRVEGMAVHTNNANGGAFRGYGINQAAISLESLIDEAARKLGIDPFEIRLRNALEVGDQTITGEILKVSVATSATIKAARDAMKEELPYIEELKRSGRRIGVGVATGYKNVGAGKGKVDDAGAIFVLKRDGRVLLRSGCVDMGQGIRTVLVQIAAEVMGIDEGIIDVINSDTALTIKQGSASGERQTLLGGKAVEIAAGQFKGVILEKAAGMLSVTPDALDIKGNAVVDAGGREVLSLADLGGRLDRAGENLEASYYYKFPKTYGLDDKEARFRVPAEEYRNYPAYAYTTQAAVVEVEDSGRVKVLKVIAVHDCGRAINPRIIEGQIEGSCVMGIGYALSEAYVVDQGRHLCRTYNSLGLPTIDETPEIRCILVEDPDPSGPFGAKGISEVATVPITPAVLNAIYDATGVRIYSLPATPERVLEGLRQKNGK